MFGYYNGPEVNRVLFSYHQMNRLLGYKKSEEEINMSCKTSVNISKDDKYLIHSLNLPSEYIAIAIGGEWGYRAFQKWGQVIRKIYDMNERTNVVLIGSSNGSEDARKIVKTFHLNRLFNCVNQYSYLQTVEIIRNSQLLLCCDGGLMHGANAVETPIISLFARLTPRMQLTDRNYSFSLYDKDDVNNIQVGQIIEEFAKFMSYDGSHPPV
jgi:heptosyltransferase-2